MVIITERYNRTVSAAFTCIYKIMPANLANCDPVLHLLSGWQGSGTRWNASFRLFYHHLKYNTIKNHKTHYNKTVQFPQSMRCTCRESILRSKKDGDWYIYPQFLAHENFKTFIKRYRRVVKSSNLRYTMSLVQGQIL